MQSAYFKPCPNKKAKTKREKNTYPHFGECFYFGVFKKSHNSAAFDCSIFDFGLFRKVRNGLNWRVDFFHSKKSCEIGGIRWNENEREEPPSTC